MTHYFMWRAPRPDEHLVVRDPRWPLIPFVFCGAKYRAWYDLRAEVQWTEITCPPCREAARDTWATILAIQELEVRDGHWPKVKP